MSVRILLCTFVFGLLSLGGKAQQHLFIPMDASQTDHLKAYGIIFNSLQEGNTAEWLLNYQGGSFMADYSDEFLKKCRLKNIKVKVISASEAQRIIAEVQQPDANTSVIQLNKAPKIAVYTPSQALPWDDAVTLALTYAEVKYDKIWDPDVLGGKLSEYDLSLIHI